ncbi:MAG: hypothetical protein LBI87_01445 [Candidatus Accumulibacter sp.]|jgi:hypothetical protein|nr:hypothetical protein [Accumulibacter sp.]
MNKNINRFNVLRIVARLLPGDAHKQLQACERMPGMDGNIGIDRGGRSHLSKPLVQGKSPGLHADFFIVKLTPV